jgi:DNA-binding MarR family transcriptional regulator
MIKFSEIAEKEQTDARVAELARIATVLQRRFLLDLFQKTSAKRLSIPQYTLLGFLAADSGVPMGHLAKQMGHATSATTGLVDRLEAAGLVRRASVKGDRRQKLVEITPKGKDLVGKMQAELRFHLNGILGKLESADRDAWVRIYRTMEEYCRELPRA